MAIKLELLLLLDFSSGIVGRISSCVFKLGVARFLLPSPPVLVTCLVKGRTQQ